MRKVIGLAVCVAWSALAALSPFDMPALFPKHQECLQKYLQAVQAKNLPGMLAAASMGAELFPEDMNWRYNVACSYALLGNKTQALKSLDEAVTLGFRDVNHMKQDSDLKSLQGDVEFAKVLARANELKDEKVRNLGIAEPALLVPGEPAYVTVTNTAFDYNTGLLTTAFKTEKPLTALYVNRDGGHSVVALTNFPNVSAVTYCEEAVKKGVPSGFPLNGFVVDGLPPPVLCNCAMAMTEGPLWRSLPRALVSAGPAFATQVRLYCENQMSFYPSHKDYVKTDLGDLYAVNTPYWLTAQGSSWAERRFVETALAALEAMKPEVREHLVKSRLVMSTLQQIFRSTRKSLKKPEDYLTGAAHPAVFEGAFVDKDAIVTAAAALTVDKIPPAVPIRTIRDEVGTLGIDYFHTADSESLFDSPFALARVVRSVKRDRTIVVAAQKNQPNIKKLHWVVLQGDPKKVTFKPLTSDDAMMSITVAWHGVYTNSLGYKTSRVDLAMIAETTNGVYSTPAFITFKYPENEVRDYAADGRILSVDYTARPGEYYDPIYTFEKRWKDVYTYAQDGTCTGWVRHRGEKTEKFNQHGHLVLETDGQGRATKGMLVEYMPRSSATPGEQQLPDLMQFTTGQSVTYRYADAKDWIGQVIKK